MLCCSSNASPVAVDTRSAFLRFTKRSLIVLLNTTTGRSIVQREGRRGTAYHPPTPATPSQAVDSPVSSSSPLGSHPAPGGCFECHSERRKERGSCYRLAGGLGRTFERKEEGKVKGRKRRAERGLTLSLSSRVRSNRVTGRRMPSNRDTAAAAERVERAMYRFRPFLSSHSSLSTLPSLSR